VSSYHAAQLGISAKINDAAARNFLSSLIAVLETLKKEIGPHDAIDNDVVAAAYVENFALKVFGMADREDRSGNATRATAKKFMAAANFLEMLKVFGAAGVSEPTDEKVRYAKWKAADIGKALREGRKPTPGPANQPELESQVPETSYPPEISVDAFTQAAPPPPFENKHHPADTPQYYSEHVTPSWPHDSGSRHDTASTSVFSDTQDNAANVASISRQAWVSDELEGQVENTHEPDRAQSALLQTSNFDPDIPSVDGPLPPGSVPTHVDDAPIVPLAPSFGVSTTFEVPHVPITPPLPPPTVPIQHRSSRNMAPPRNQSRYGPPIPPEPQGEPDLTPQQIAKAQKHCKFAISALDYEDFAQARKDLREALRILGN